MKKIFLILSLLVSAFAFGQAGYTNIFAKYHWDGGLFRRLGIPAGDSAQFLSGQSQRQGAVYMDTVNTPASPNGFYIYEDPTGGNAPFWNLQTNEEICQNRLISEWSVSWQGVGFNFSVHGGLTNGQGTYQIGCSFYTADSATVTFSAADPDEDRIDIIYLNASGVQVREGELAAPGTAVRPTVDADEILLTEVLVAAGATSPTTITQLVVYNENTESVVTNTGTTTNGANATFVFTGSLSTNVTSINHNDVIYFTKVPDLSTWNVLGFDGLSLAIQLKAIMPTNANIGVALQVGTTTVGTEVIVPLVKTNTSSYQQISIPLSAFGNMSNQSITRVRFRYIRQGNNAQYTGFYLDYIYFINGLSTGPSPQATFTFNPPTGFQVTPTNTQQSPGTWTMSYSPGTLPGQYYTREGWVTLPDFVDTVSTLDGRAKVADGGVVDGNELFLQVVDANFPGLMTSAMFSRLDSNYYIGNWGNLDTLAILDSVSPNITRIKSIGCNGCTDVITTDTTIIFDVTGVGGSSLFPTTGTGTATGSVVGELGANSLTIESGVNTIAQFTSNAVSLFGGAPSSGSVINLQSTLAQIGLDASVFAAITFSDVAGVATTLIDTEDFFLNGTTLVFAGEYVFSTTDTPSSASDTGVTGQWAWDGSFFYICVATNTWRRVAHATW